MNPSNVPKWAEGVSLDDLLAEVKRRSDYNLQGWGASYQSADYWRRRALDAETRSPWTDLPEEGER